jgi:hypothetical protein
MENVVLGGTGSPLAITQIDPGFDDIRNGAANNLYKSVA